MLSKIITWVYSILIVILLIDTVVLNILILIHSIENYKNKQSRNLEYYIKKCYGHFDDIPAGEELKEDIQILNDMIGKLKNQLETSQEVEY